MIYLRLILFCCAANFTVLGSRVQGRKYIQAADYGDSWILLMSDMQKDTLNAELIMLPVSNTTDLMQLETNTTLMPADSGHIAANISQVCHCSAAIFWLF